MPKMWATNDKSIKGEKMNNENKDIEKIKNYLSDLGFVCNSDPSAQNLVYAKNEDLLIIKNNK